MPLALFSGPESFLCSIETNGIVTALGDEGPTALGWSPAEFGRRALARVVHPRDRLGAERVWCAPASDGERSGLENRFLCKDGSYAWLRWTCVRSDGAWLCAGQDVSGRRLIEEALLAGDHGARAIVAALPDGVIALDLEGRVTDVNDRYCEITGYAREEILEWQPPYPTWPPEHRAGYMRSFAHERLVHTAEREVTYQRKDRSRFPAVLVVSPLRDASGRVTGSIGVLRDLSGSEARLREAEATARISNWTWDATSDRLQLSGPLLDALALPAGAEPPIAEYLALVDEDDWLREQALWSSAVAERSPFATEYRMRPPGSASLWLDVRGHPEHDDAGAFVGFAGTVQDITERKRSGEQARFHGDLLQQLDAAVVATDLDGVVTLWNAAAERLYGWPAREAIGIPVISLLVPTGEDAAAQDARDELARNGTWHGEFPVRRKDGSVLPVLLNNRVILDERRRPVGAVGLSLDDSARKSEHDRLGRTTRFLQTVTEHMAEGLLVLDDSGRLTYMNGAAERMLLRRSKDVRGQSAHILVHQSWPDGSPRNPEDSPLTRTARLRAPMRIDEDVFADREGNPVLVTYTVSPLVTDTGANGAVVVFSDISEQHAERLRLKREVDELAWVDRIRDALQERRFILFAQPIIDIATGATISHELLLRMRHEGRLVAPSDFLPTAEKHGHVKDIDRWVIEQAAAIAGTGATVQVNVSAASFGDPELPRYFDAALRAAGADPGNVVVELTETTLMRADAAEEIARHLEMLGLHLSLDDFGTGYGGFTYLKRLPVSQLKIDREFVRDLVVDPASHRVIEAVVALARGFRQKTVAEGVENQATLDLLGELGVDYAQGFHVGRPVPVDESALTVGFHPPK